MRVVAIVTIDGTTRTEIEGDSRFIGGAVGDRLEERGLGFWLSNWRSRQPKGGRACRKSLVFVPWTSCLYLETVKAVGERRNERD